MNTFFMPIIAKVCPGAPMIFMIRDGRETAFSTFKQNFKEYYWFKFNLEDAIQNWAQTIELVRSSKDALGIVYHESFYEKLVLDPKDNLNELLNFLKLDWTDDLLEFYKQKTQVNTASYSQVRQPLYQSSLAHTKNNYPVQHANMSGLLDLVLRELEYC